MSTRTVGQLSEPRVLQCETLPTLPVVAMELLDKTRNPDVAISEIAELIQNDPGLAGKVLKTVNSSFYGLPKPCPSIDRAIGMLGLRAVKSLVLGFSMVNLTGESEDGFDMDAFWRRTILGSAGARQVAKLAGLGEPDEAFASALFQDMGMLAIYAAAPASYAPMVKKAGAYHEELFDAEQQRWGFNHTTIGAELAVKWRMPDQIVAAIRHHHSPDEATEHTVMVRAVALGSLIARTVTEGSEGPAFTELVGRASEWFGWEQPDLLGLLESVTQTSREVARLLGKTIGELPNPQALLAAANQRLVEQQIQVQREADSFQQQAKAFEHAATTDGLTGIANRKHFDEVMDAAMRHAESAGEPLAVLFSDADKFKLVNDNYGHHAGDLVLIELARRLTETLGERGTVCRYGGEEFAVVLPAMSLEAASAVGEELRACIADTPFDLAGVPNCPDRLDRSVSVGVAAWQPGQPKVPAEELVQRADKAVYLAKESGRNNVKRWGIDLDEHSDLSAGLSPTDNDLPDLNPQEQTFRVLMIEDDALAARLLQTAFEKLGYVEVTVARTGTHAVEVLRDSLRPSNKQPDLIISDLKVPGFTGLQILKALKSNPKFKSIPIIILTAEDDTKQLQECREAGATSIHNKLEVCASLQEWCEGVLEPLRTAAQPTEGKLLGSRTVIISDTHLACGRRGARSAQLLRPIWQGADELIVNGDVAELSDARWRVHAARQVMELADLCEQDGVKLTFLSGNHDPLITDRRYLRLHHGEVFLTHGDMLHPSISPWVSDAQKLRMLHDDAIASLQARQQPCTIDEQAQVVQHVSNQKWDQLASHQQPLQGRARKAASHTAKCARVLWFWHRLPKLASQFAERFAPECRYFIFGHFHRAGVWHLGGRTIINTGSYHAPCRPHAVVIQGRSLALHRVRFNLSGHRLDPYPRFTAQLRADAQQIPGRAAHTPAKPGRRKPNAA